MALLGQIEGCHRERRHAFEGDKIPLLERVGVIGEEFEQSANFAGAAQERQNNNGRDAKGLAGFQIHARIGFRIVTAENLAAGDALAGESGTNLQARTNSRSTGAGAGVADHFVSLRQGERGSRRARDVLLALDK